MPTSPSSVVFAVSLGVAVAAQGPAGSAVQQPDPTQATAGGGAATPIHPGVFTPIPGTPDPRWQQGQETDYSPRALFQQEHGDFMLKRERFNPMLEIGGSYLSDAAVQHEAGRFDLLQLRFDLEAPITVSPDAYLTLGAFYGSRHYMARNMVGFSDETLYAAGVKAGFGLFVDKNVLLEGLFAPGSWSDWDGTLQRTDYDYPARMLATFRYSDDFFFKIGARYNEVYEDANVLPTVGFSWASSSVRVDVLAPESFEVSMWPSPDFGILIGSKIEGAEYHVRSSLATGREQADLRVQEVLIYLGGQWRMNDYTSIAARVGASVAGDYKLDDGLAATKKVTGTLEPAFFFDLTFGIDF